MVFTGVHCTGDHSLEVADTGFNLEGAGAGLGCAASDFSNIVKYLGYFSLGLSVRVW